MLLQSYWSEWLLSVDENETKVINIVDERSKEKYMTKNIINNAFDYCTRARKHKLNSWLFIPSTAILMRIKIFIRLSLWCNLPIRKIWYVFQTSLAKAISYLFACIFATFPHQLSSRGQLVLYDHQVPLTQQWAKIKKRLAHDPSSLLFKQISYKLGSLILK